MLIKDGYNFMKKKTLFPLYSIIAFAFVLFIAGFVAVTEVFESKNTFFYTGFVKFTTGDLIIWMILIGGGLFVSAIAVLLHKNVRNNLLRVLIVIVAAIASCLLLLGACISAAFEPKSYVEIVSDDGEHSIVIGEDCYVFSPYGGDIFEKTSFCTMKKIGRYNTKIDYYTPFSDGKYYAVWNETDFQLHYDCDGTGKKYTSVTVKYLAEKKP